MPDFTDLATKLKKYLFSAGTLDQQANGTPQTQTQPAAPVSGTSSNSAAGDLKRNEEFVRQKRLKDAMAAKATTGQKK